MLTQSNYLFKTLPLFVVVVFLAGCSNIGSLMIHEKQSPFDFDKTVALVESNAKAMGWAVPKVYDFQASMKKFDQPDPGKIKIVKLCQPQYAGKMLAHDDSKFVAAMMPCSIGIYEKSDGKVYVSSMNMKLMSKMFGGTIGDTLAQVAADDAQILSFLTK